MEADTSKKQKFIDDLMTLSKSKNEIGKSTRIAAMANR